jgi:hypothetical protein
MRWYNSRAEKDRLPSFIKNYRPKVNIGVNEHIKRDKVSRLLYQGNAT